MTLASHYQMLFRADRSNRAIFSLSTYIVDDPMNDHLAVIEAPRARESSRSPGGEKASGDAAANGVTRPSRLSLLSNDPMRVTS